MVKIKFEHAFRHSYSREFGRPITPETPESYCIVYNPVRSDSQFAYVPLSLEYISRTNTYDLTAGNGKMRTLLPKIKFLSSVKEANTIATELFNQYLKLQ